MPTKECKDELEEFEEAVSFVQNKFFEGEFKVGQARIEIRKILKEASAEKPYCRKQLKGIVDAIDRGIVQEYLRRGF